MRLSVNDFKFPLYTKGVESAKADYALYLLNRDIAQLRWHCGLPTKDLRKTLLNLHDLMCMATMANPPPAGQAAGALPVPAPRLRSISPPPHSSAPGSPALQSVAAAAAMAGPAAAMAAAAASASTSAASSPKKETVAVASARSPSYSSSSSSSCEEATENSTATPRTLEEPLPEEVAVTEVRDEEAVAPPKKEPSDQEAGCCSASPSEEVLKTRSQHSAVFWGDVSNRTKGLSIQTSFQRRK